MTSKISRVPHNKVVPKESKTPVVNQAEEAIDRAVERIYRMYGPDLSVFFQAAQDQLGFERREGQKRRQQAP